MLTEDWQWRALRLDPALQAPADLDPLARLRLAGGRAEQRCFRWAWDLTPQGWRGFVSTVSHVRLLPEAERVEVLDETERLAARGAAPLIHDALCVRWWPDANRRQPASIDAGR